MFELVNDRQEDELLVAIVGIGSVGCKIIHDIERQTGLDIVGVVNKLYVHTSQESLTNYTHNPSERLLISEHIYFLEQQIEDWILGKDIIFLVAGLGGGTGSHVPQHIARISKKLGVLCVGLFSFPFEFEGREKKLKSQQAYLDLIQYTDSLICIENDNFLDYSLNNQSLPERQGLFYESNLHFNAVIIGLINLVNSPGLINVDFSDLKQLLKNMGTSAVGFSSQHGEERSENAVTKLLELLRMQRYEIEKAKGCIVNITSGLDINIGEFEVIGNAITTFIGIDATVVIGACINPEMKDEMAVTLIVTGLPELPINIDVKNNDFDIIKLSKSIIFEPHQSSAGLSILSYFNEFLNQNYSGIEAKVSIEQHGNAVSLIVETLSGEVKKVEKSLHEFGLVVVGDKQASEVLDSKINIERLNMKLEMAAMELKHNEKIICLYQSENNNYKGRITSLEEQMGVLQKTICDSLSYSQREVSLSFSAYRSLPDSLLHLLETNKEKELTELAKRQIKEQVDLHITDSDKAIKLRELADNVICGVAGNSLYSFIVSILATLPK